MPDNDKISKALGIRPLKEIQNEVQPLQPEGYDDTLPAEVAKGEIVPVEEEHANDIELARQNVQNIIEMGDDAVKEMVEIAKQSESPRAFEVVSTLMKTLLDANKDFVDLSSKKKFESSDKPQNETNVTNNNLIVSTADLLKMIKGEDDAT
jgi:hypothetical protein